MLGVDTGESVPGVRTSVRTPRLFQEFFTEFSALMDLHRATILFVNIIDEVLRHTEANRTAALPGFHRSFLKDTNSAFASSSTQHY